MLAIIDVSSKKVIEIFPAGNAAIKNQNVYLQELIDIHRNLTGRERQFRSVAEAKRAVAKALGEEFFVGREEPSPPARKRGRPRKAPSSEHHIPSMKGDGPVAIVWRTCEKMKGRPRKDVIEACAKAGVKRSTAATQYQRWRKTQQ